MNQQEIAGLLAKARRSIKAAERLLHDGDYDFAISRAYYGMFYGAQAMLLTRDLRRSKHSGVIAAFQEHFVKPSEVPGHFFHLLRDGFEDRAEGDYGFAEISRDQAESGIQAARQFVTELGPTTGIVPRIVSGFHPDKIISSGATCPSGESRAASNPKSPFSLPIASP